MGKVTFSARKDPLLPPRPTSPPADDAIATTKPARASASAPARTRARRTAPPRRTARGVEEPAGVIAIDAAEPAPTDSPVRGVGAPKAAGRPGRPRPAGRRVQTSISLPPETWDTLDALGEAAGVATGELLAAILNGAMPDSPEDALAALEQLLTVIPADDGPHEERNHRLALELRAQLDALVKALGAGPRMHRSLLIRALLATGTPPDSDSARELITARRINAMRSAVLAASSD